MPVGIYSPARRKKAAKALPQTTYFTPHSQVAGEISANCKGLAEGMADMNSPGIELADKPRQDGGWEAGESGRILDNDHLERMTLGDRGLEREVLQIFVRQTAIMVGRLVGAEPRFVTAAAHTLLGSARGIGAWRVARAAERVERASGEGSDEKLTAAIMELRAASLEANAAIGARLSEKA